MIFLTARIAHIPLLFPNNPANSYAYKPKKGDRFMVEYDFPLGYVIYRADIPLGDPSRVAYFLKARHKKYYTRENTDHRAARIEELEDLVVKALSLASQNICRHESTHRAGFIWTICDDCGQQWADDKGGFKPDPALKELERLSDRLVALKIKPR